MNRAQTVILSAALVCVLAIIAPRIVHSAQASQGEQVRTTQAITISPIHLIVPFGELAWEYRVGRSDSLVLIGGVGEVTHASGVNSLQSTYTVWEAGVQYRRYVMGNFDEGMQLGAELMFLDVQRNKDGTDIEHEGEGLTFGPFIGYKNTTEGGFVFDTQFGFQYLLVSGEASVGGQDSTESDDKFGGLLNINIGYAF